jgi:hypothetical protein
MYDKFYNYTSFSVLFRREKKYIFLALKAKEQKLSHYTP